VEPTQAAEGPKRLSREKIGNFLKTTWRDFVILFLLAGAIVAFDQWTKAWVRANVPLGADWLPASLAWLEPYARIRHTFNTGAAFGLFQQGGLIFAILAVIVSVLIISYFPQTSRRDWWLRLALALQLGGALGNLTDRIARSGQVTDFISVGNFAIFNVADSCISVGVVILILGVWLVERKLKKEKQKEEQETEAQGE
jgi:signal peptidase II